MCPPKEEDPRIYAQHALEAALRAGEVIMDVYRNFDGKVIRKEDASPLTEADLRAHRAITDQLQKTALPVLSEEGTGIPYEERRSWDRFWLVDPLDGTKEFIKRNGEFTVNIALIEKGKPILGVVYIPVSDEVYLGMEKLGSYKALNPGTLEEILSDGQKLPMIVHQERNKIRVVVSKSHLNAETKDFVARLRQEYREVQEVSRGSSLKICLVAEGVADMYPRFGPTMEWDTAAGHAVARFSGKSFTHAHTGEELVYNKENLRNPSFMVK